MKFKLTTGQFLDLYDIVSHAVNKMDRRERVGGFTVAAILELLNEIREQQDEEMLR